MAELKIVSFACLSVVCAVQLRAQTVPADLYSYPRTYSDFSNLKRDPRQLTFSRLPGISTDYRIGPGDRLSIEVVDLPALSLSLAVSNSGTVNMPLLGTIQAGDMTAGELENAIAEKLKEKNLMRKPEVLVDVIEYVAKPVYILGEVDKAGEYIMSQQLTLMDAILIAGGLDITAGRYGYLHRRLREDEEAPPSAPPDPRNRPVFNTLRRNERLPQVNPAKPQEAAPGTQVTRIDLEPVKKGGVVTPNLLMRKGDVFIVPRRTSEPFYVIGDVRSPGAFELLPEEPLLVSQAIAQAGGPTNTAKMAKGILVRYDSAGKRVERPVDFSAIIKGKAPDFRVLADDIVFIPGSKIRTLTYGLLGVIPSTVQESVQQLPTK